MRKFTTAEVELMDIRQIKESSIVKYCNNLYKETNLVEVKLPTDVEFTVWVTPNKTEDYDSDCSFIYKLALDDVDNLKDIKDYYIGKLNAVYAFINIYLNKHPEVKKVDILEPFKFNNLENGILTFRCKINFGDNTDDKV